MSKSVYTNPADSYSPQNNSHHRKEKSIYQDESGNQNRLIGKSVREVEEAYHDKKTHKDGFDNRKYLLNNSRQFLYRIELLKRKNRPNNCITRSCYPQQIIQFQSSVGEGESRNEVSRHSYFSRNQKRPYHNQEIEGYTDESKEKFVTTHKRKYR